MRLKLSLAAAVLCSSFAIAHADTINTYNLSAVLTDGSATGTVTLDETTGKFINSNFNVVASTGSATFTGAPTSTTSGTNYVSNVFASTASTAYGFNLVLPLTSLIGYTGGSLCTVTALCSGKESSGQYLGADADPVMSGSLKLIPAAAVTPEPSSLLLLGTGVLMLGGFLRKRSI